MTSDYYPPAAPAGTVHTTAMLSPFLYHIDRVDDLSFLSVLLHSNANGPGFTIADLEQYMTQMTCPVMLAAAKQEWQ